MKRILVPLFLPAVSFAAASVSIENELTSFYLNFRSFLVVAILFLFVVSALMLLFRALVYRFRKGDKNLKAAAETMLPFGIIGLALAVLAVVAYVLAPYVFWAVRNA